MGITNEVLYQLSYLGGRSILGPPRILAKDSRSDYDERISFASASLRDG